MASANRCLVFTKFASHFGTLISECLKIYMLTKNIRALKSFGSTCVPFSQYTA